MADLISRAAAVRALASSNGDYLDALERFERLPAVDSAPVVHGQWLPSNDFLGYCYCSECRDTYIDPAWRVDGKWSFCPNCGAKMDGERRESE